jgi:hypothetical protein
MYGTVTAGPAIGIGALAVTGISVIWLLVAFVALVSAGITIHRLVPRKE